MQQSFPNQHFDIWESKFNLNLVNGCNTLGTNNYSQVFLYDW